MQLTGKSAIVTGASRGIGSAIAIDLAARGALVVVNYNSSAASAQEVVAAITSAGGKAIAIKGDVSKLDEANALVKAAIDAYGRLDILVNNAAVFNAPPIETLTPEQWDAAFAVNARAPALCIRHAIDLMRQGGSIVNIADIQADKPRSNYPAYCASKGALISLTKACAKALAGRNICVNAVSPGIAQWSENASDTHKQAVLKQVPMNRPGTPRDIASAVVFLASQNYITGQNLRVDGGWCTS